MEKKNEQELTLTRIFDAPRVVVFNAWIDPTLIQKWWGPNGVTTKVTDWDVRPGGSMNVVMIAGLELGEIAGQEWPMGGEFKEVVAPTKLVFSANAIMNGKVILEQETTVTFEEENGKTHMTVHIQVTKTTSEAEGPLRGMEMGWNQQVDKLVTYISHQK